MSGNTLYGTSATAGTCVGADSPEVLFHGDTVPGVLTLGLPAGHGIHVRTDCVLEGTELGCAVAGMVGQGGAGGMAGSGGMTGSGGAGGGVTGEVIEVPTYGGSLTIIVEAIDPFQAGPFQVPLWFTPGAP